MIPQNVPWTHGYAYNRVASSGSRTEMRGHSKESRATKQSGSMGSVDDESRIIGSLYIRLVTITFPHGKPPLSKVQEPVSRDKWQWALAMGVADYVNYF